MAKNASRWFILLPLCLGPPRKEAKDRTVFTRVDEKRLLIKVLALSGLQLGPIERCVDQ